jgi:hypothetical protein
LNCSKGQPLGIGAQGLGGLTTVLDVKVMDYPTHAANKPVAIIPNCAATRHAHFVLDGSGPAHLRRRNWKAGRKSPGKTASRKRVNLDTMTPEEMQSWKSGRHPAAQRQDADRPRRRAQAHGRYDQQGRKAAGGFHQPLYLLRRPGRSGAVTKWSARPARPPPRGWTSSPAPCWKKPA